MRLQCGKQESSDGCESQDCNQHHETSGPTVNAVSMELWVMRSRENILLVGTWGTDRRDVATLKDHQILISKENKGSTGNRAAHKAKEKGRLPVTPCFSLSWEPCWPPRPYDLHTPGTMSDPGWISKRTDCRNDSGVMYCSDFSGVVPLWELMTSPSPNSLFHLWFAEQKVSLSPINLWGSWSVWLLYSGGDFDSPWTLFSGELSLNLDLVLWFWWVFRQEPTWRISKLKSWIDQILRSWVRTHAGRLHLLFPSRSS